ncbi:DUF4087 domain-containing protein [Limnobacter litoralis]|uniref:DUF4087 domain-containing protein n=1 Tax=Limnobacter litoralis TaxID=481366 RepID=UPI0024E0BEF5|nr:DUF4087 domain-containing protein [Limnobacter litoralis]
MPRTSIIKHLGLLGVCIPLLLITTACNASKQVINECGWFINPVPNEVTFATKHESWIISQQGGHEAQGDWPEFPDKQWAVTNSGFHGYGCACMKLEVETATHFVQKIVDSKIKSLDYCRATLKLKTPTK